MSDNQTQGATGSQAQGGGTAVMPPVQPQYQPPPPVGPSKSKTPGWAWALIGLLALVVIVGGFLGVRALNRRADLLKQRVGEATATLSAEASRVAAARAAAAAAANSAASGGSGASGGSAASGGSGDSGSSGSSAESGDSGDSAGNDEPEPGEEADSTADYQSKVKQDGDGNYSTGAIHLGRGRMELSVWVKSTTGHPLKAEFARGSGNYTTWWHTSTATAGQTRSVIVVVPSASNYYFRVEAEQGTTWTYRIRWKPV